MTVRSDGGTEGTVGGGAVEIRAAEEALRRIERRQSGVCFFDLDPDSPQAIGSTCGGTVRMAIEVFPPARHLVLFGGGHVALAFARLCAELGWLHSIVDGRADLLTPERFPGAAARTAQDPAAFAARADLAGYSHILIFTHDCKIDSAILQALAPRGFPGYIGMIGSARKWAESRRGLEAEGVPRAWLDAVRCPIGLAIGSRTSAEIAVAIAAEVIQLGGRA
jgi:xanthine dehydrogenase accessory factor